MNNNIKNTIKFHFDNLYNTNPKPCGNILLYQLGEMFCNFDNEIAEHTQYCFEFTYVLSGNGKIFSNNECVDIKQHDCFWSIIDETHKIQSDSKNPLRFCYLAYNIKNYPKVTNIHEIIKAFTPKNRLLSDSSLRTDFNNLLSEISQSDELMPDMLESIVRIIIFKCFRSLTSANKKKYIFNKPEKSFLSYKITSYIDNNLYLIKNLIELENVFNYNYQYLSRCFYNSMNITLHAYFLNKKMETASQLLTDSEFSISQISEKLNYSCTQAFTYSFNKFFKTTPDKFRTKFKNK